MTLSITVLNQLGNERRPASLVAGPKTSAVVTVEVLVEQNVITPVRIGLEIRLSAENRATAAVGLIA